jgi:hypothetical protein
VGAGPPPLTHPARVPPARPFDERAAAAAVPTGDAAEVAAWLAGCGAGVPPRVAVHVVLAGEGDVAWAGADADAFARIPAGGALPSVGHVARAVDQGRDLAAAAAAASATVLAIGGAGDEAAPARLAAWLSGRAQSPQVRGPLGALWRLGSEDIAVLCGVALGAGEQGLALACGGRAGIAATGTAVAVQPALRPRVRVVGAAPDALFAAVAERLGPAAHRGAGAR